MTKKSVGEILREERERQNKTLKEVAHETYIHESYLEAIENNEFKKLPPETYTVGFIQVYAEYLGLDPAEVVQRYKSMITEESPTPPQLYINPKANGNLLLKIGLGISAIIVLVGIIFIVSLLSGGEKQSSGMLKILEETKDYKKYYKLARVGEEFKVPTPSGDVDVKFASINPDKSVDVSVAGKVITVKLQETAEVDLTGDNQTDLKIHLKSSKDRTGQFEFVVMKTRPPKKLKKEDVPGAVMVKDKPETVMVEITGKGKCWIAYSTDGKNETERVIQRGTKIDLKFSKSLKIMSSSAGLISLKINNEDVETGKTGTMMYSIFEWKNINGKGYALVRTDMK